MEGIGADDVVLEDEGEGAILLPGLEGEVRNITDTTLADAHAPKRHLMQQLAETAEDLGGGFLLQEAPVLVQRGPDGSIARVVPLNEIPGVEYTPGGGLQVDPGPEVQKTIVSPKVLPRDQRNKLVEILALRLFKDYRQRPHTGRYNPFYDGIPDLSAGSPEHLQPLPGTTLYPATDGQIFEWLKRFIAARVSVVNKNRFGKDNLQDLALHIER